MAKLSKYLFSLLRENFPFENFLSVQVFIQTSQKSVYCYMVITLWKCEYCLVWALNKSILFGSNSLKVSVLCDMDSEKRFYYSLMWKELSESVIIAWYELWKSVWYHLVVTPWNCQCCLIWDLKRYLLLLVATIWKEEYFFIFLDVFHACIVWPLGWFWFKNNFVYIWFSWSFSSNLN